MKTIPQYKSIILEVKDKVAYIYLNRPDNGNLINGKMIEELYDSFQFMTGEDEIRCVVISSKGNNFCLGPDWDWLSNSLILSKKESIEESLTIGKLMFMVYSFPKPVMCVVTGHAAAGGVGVTSVCDIVIASEESTFVFDEVKYGYTPSLYAPYVIKKTGESKARELFITGIPFKADEAKSIGLIDFVVPKNKIEEKTKEMINEFMSGAPSAISLIKDIFLQIRTMRYDEVLKYTSECVAELKTNNELREGVTAKLENRKPNWLA
jgi:methylglutaconyl-CoA hydratase